MHRTFVHLELNTGDTDTARDFYRQVFQWDFEDIPMVDGSKYTQIRPPTGLMGGMQAKMGPGAPTAWMPYVGVQSVEETVARVVEAGGVVVEPYQPVPGFGALAIVEDPTGASFGLWETAMPVPAEDSGPGAEAADDAEIEHETDEPAPPPKKAAAKKAAARSPAAKKPAAKKKSAAKKPAVKKAAPEPAPEPVKAEPPVAKAKKKAASKSAKTSAKKRAPAPEPKAAKKKKTTTAKKRAPAPEPKAAAKKKTTTARGKKGSTAKKTARGKKGKR